MTWINLLYQPDDLIHVDLWHPNKFLKIFFYRLIIFRIRHFSQSLWFLVRSFLLFGTRISLLSSRIINLFFMNDCSLVFTWFLLFSALFLLFSTYFLLFRTFYLLFSTRSRFLSSSTFTLFFKYKCSFFFTLFNKFGSFLASLARLSHININKKRNNLTS